ATAMGQAEKAAFRIQHFHADSPSPCLVDDDARVGVQLLFGWRADVELLVDRVTGLQGETLHRIEAQLVIEGESLAVVIKHREVDEGAAPRLQPACQVMHQSRAYAGIGSLAVNRQAPEA